MHSSLAGKVVLIKSNLTGIPQYSINWFKFPTNIYKDIDGPNRNFFWKDNCDNISDKHKLHPLAWDKIFRAKYERGLGIRKTEDINETFLTKQGRKILTQPHNIWVKIVRTKYLSNDAASFFKSNKCSSAWKSILDQLDLRKRGLAWILGNGKSIGFWHVHLLKQILLIRSTWIKQILLMKRQE